MKTAAILAAGGRGSRLSASRAKQFIEVAGRPLLAHTLGRFDRCDLIDGVIVVLPREGFLEHRALMSRWVAAPKLWAVVEGGRTRQDSVANGLAALAADFAGIVLVHDGARPLVTDAILRETASMAERWGAALAALPVSETIKEIGDDGWVSGTVDRARLYRAQTPQGFRVEILREALSRARAEGFCGTDESALVERLGIDVRIVPGSERNIKVTTPEDLELAEYYLKLEAAP